MNAACPSQGDLSGFVLGNLSRPAWDRIAGHITHCPACEKVLLSFDDLADSLLDRLRQPVPVDLHPFDAVPPRLVAAARSVGPVGPTGPLSQGPVGPTGPALPRKLGKFELLEELGLGSFGHVFRARDTELDRTVAIKIPRAAHLASREDADRFVREARSAAQLKHPGIVALYDTGQTEDGTCYLVEEFVQGATLAARLGEGRLSLRKSAELIAEIAEALDYAHRHGVIHRDLKPSNILVDQEGQPHVMDFGLAKRDLGGVEEQPLTLDGQVLGTPAYMSPEQARGEAHQVDARTDVYSLGVILYELLTGERPFRGNRRMLVLQVLQDEPRPPRSLNDKVPRDLETICLKAMAKTPSRRYATAGELAGDLRRYLASEPIRARPIGRLERLWRWCRRNPVAASLLLAVTLGSAFGLVYLSILSEDLVRSTALESAAQEAEMLEAVNSRYSAEVEDVQRQEFIGMDGKPIRVRGVRIKIPAQFTIELGQHISAQSKSGMEVRLYSNYPFRTRKDGGPRDLFEKQALEYMSRHPDRRFWSFEDYQGRPTLRYVWARVMEKSCIDCHNGHDDSPKKNWKVGDVGGVVEIIRPLDRDVARTRDGLRGSFILMGVISGSLLGVSVLVLVLSNRRRRILLDPARGSGQ
jgi:serine/threonine protein kinase